jgi:hypothetical protein
MYGISSTHHSTPGGNPTPRRQQELTLRRHRRSSARKWCGAHHRCSESTRRYRFDDRILEMAGETLHRGSRESAAGVHRSDCIMHWSKDVLACPFFTRVRGLWRCCCAQVLASAGSMAFRRSSMESRQFDARRSLTHRNRHTSPSLYAQK